MPSARSVYRPRLAGLAAALLLAATPAMAKEPVFSRTVFFGDSLTDAGYFRSLLPPEAQPVIGQFTTNPGLVWSQYLANYYGTDASAAWLATGAAPRPNGGDNYAVGGARVGTDVTGALGYTPALTSQVDAYLARNGGRADARALYTVWGGANDLFAITAGAPVQATLASAVGAQIGIVGKLDAAGARYILVPTIPDLGVTPGFLAQGPTAVAQGTALATAYNDALFAGLGARNLRVIPLDTFHLLREITADAATYGFRNVTGTACQPQITAQSLTCNPTSMVSPDAAWAYAFADGVHPSSGAHAILGDYAVATIEAPRQMSLLPHAAALSGRLRAGRVADQIEDRGESDGGRLWGGIGWTGLRHERDEAGDGFDGGGPSLMLGYDRGAGAWVFGGWLDMGREQVDFGADRGEFRQRHAELGGYLGWRTGALRLDAQASHAQLAHDVRREVPLGPAVRMHEGSPDGQVTRLGIGGGWEFGQGGFRHGPVLRALAQKIRIDGHVESDPQLATALAFPSQDFDSLYVGAGWQANWQAGRWQPHARVMVERETGDRPAEAFARMTSLPASGEYAVPAPVFGDRHVSLGLGVRGQLRGFDVVAGGQVDVGDEGGRQVGLHLALGRAF